MYNKVVINVKKIYIFIQQRHTYIDQKWQQIKLEKYLYFKKQTFIILNFH